MSRLLIALMLWSLLAAPLAVQAQFETDYEPLRLQDPLPDEFRMASEARHQQEMNRAATRTGSEPLDGEATSRLLRLTAYRVRSLQVHGVVYYNDELTAYVRELGAKLALRAKPETRQNLRFYVARLPSVNAVCFADGSIMVNVGLLARMRNEEELAFVLAHEIAHYEQAHSLQVLGEDLKAREALRRKDVKNGAGQGLTAEDALNYQLNRHSFSRQQEMEADSMGYALARSAGMDLQAAVQALERLHSDYAERDVPPERWVEWLTASSFTPDTAWFEVDSSHIEATKGEEMDSLERLMRTHPDIEARIAKVQNRIDREGAGSRGERLLSPERHERMRTVARFELIETLSRDHSYAKLFFETLLLRQSYPNNLYLTARLSDALLGMAQLMADSRSSLMRTVDKTYLHNSKLYAQYLEFLDEAPRKNFQAWAEGMQAELRRQAPDHPSVAFNYALTLNLNENKGPAEAAFEYFIKRFPDSCLRPRAESIIKNMQ